MATLVDESVRLRVGTGVGHVEEEGADVDGAVLRGVHIRVCTAKREKMCE